MTQYRFYRCVMIREFLKGSLPCVTCPQHSVTVMATLFAKREQFPLYYKWLTRGFNPGTHKIEAVAEWGCVLYAIACQICCKFT